MVVASLMPQLGPLPVTQACALLGVEPAIFPPSGWHPILQTGVPLATLVSPSALVSLFTSICISPKIWPNLHINCLIDIIT